MQTRLLSCTAGGLLGVVFASPMKDVLGLTPGLALIACSLAGVAVGYVASILYDVFAGTGKDRPNPAK